MLDMFGQPRQQRGMEIAATKQLRQKGDLWIVPSASGNGTYVVDPTEAETSCSCPDYEARSLPCKHLFAVEYIRQEVTTADGATVVTEAVRVTYAQNWPAYNRAQCEEKAVVQTLLRGLCDGIAQPEQSNGRPRLPLGDVIYGSAMKVYGTMSGRRSTTDLRACEAAGLVGRAAHYNSVFRFKCFNGKI